MQNGAKTHDTTYKWDNDPTQHILMDVAVMLPVAQSATQLVPR